MFIYLDNKSIEKALAYFKTSLNQHGVLFLGTSDFVRYSQHGFKINMMKHVTYYTKGEANTSLSSLEKPPGDIPTTAYVEKQKTHINPYHVLNKMLAHQQFHEALLYINNKIKLFNSNYLLYRYKGEALIGLGDIATARDVLEEALKYDSMDAKSHFLKALVWMGDDDSLAKQALERSIYLKQAFPEAYYHRALLALGQKHTEEGLRCLRQAKRYAEQCNKNDNVMGSKGCMGDLIEVINRELVYYQGKNDDK